MVKENAVTSEIPEGRPKSGRTWKVKQTFRSSLQQRSGILKHLNKTFEQKEAERAKRDAVKEFEQELKDEKKQKLADAKTRREEQLKRRQANEYKNSVFQEVPFIIHRATYPLISYL
jgi:uncharacterized membrane protein YkoI